MYSPWPAPSRFSRPGRTGLDLLLGVALLAQRRVEARQVLGRAVGGGAPAPAAAAAAAARRAASQSARASGARAGAARPAPATPRHAPAGRRQRQQRADAQQQRGAGAAQAGSTAIMASPSGFELEAQRPVRIVLIDFMAQQHHARRTAPAASVARCRRPWRRCPGLGRDLQHALACASGSSASSAMLAGVAAASASCRSRHGRFNCRMAPFTAAACAGADGALARAAPP